MANPVLVGRALCTALAFAQFSIVLYTLITDGTPFRGELLTPWMSATLIDFYITMTLFIAWVWYKEETWTQRLVWTVLVICTGSVATSGYVAIEFFKLSLDDSPHLVLLKDRHTRKGGKAPIYSTQLSPQWRYLMSSLRKRNLMCSSNG